MDVGGGVAKVAGRVIGPPGGVTFIPRSTLHLQRGGRGVNYRDIALKLRLGTWRKLFRLASAIPAQVAGGRQKLPSSRPVLVALSGNKVAAGKVVRFPAKVAGKINLVDT